MAHSTHRLRRTERRRQVDGATITLAAIQERFLTHQRARGNAPGSLRHYAATFRDFDTFLEEKGIAPAPTPHDPCRI